MPAFTIPSSSSAGARQAWDSVETKADFWRVAQRWASELLAYAEVELTIAGRERVDWSRPATEVDRHIRGLSPFPGAWCEIDGERTKLLGSRLAEGNGEPGQHLGEFRIACGSGAVQVTEAQRQGKKPMSAAEILRGMKLPERLS